jgi:GR25 family glycosyltransferase involved in LPS biosynthesis
MEAYGPDGGKLVSLIDAVQRAIQLARENAWDRVAIFEDDIKFRANFSQLWDEVSVHVDRTDWDLLCLHRLDCVEQPFQKVRLVRITHNSLCHCLIMTKNAFDGIENSLNYCISKGYPLDFLFGVYSIGEDGKIFATTKNLTGQAGGFVSGLQGGMTPRKSFFYSEFKSFRHPAEKLAVTAGLRIVRAARRVSR